MIRKPDPTQAVFFTPTNSHEELNFQLNSNKKRVCNLLIAVEIIARKKCQFTYKVKTNI